jgi:hypothetical protein
MDRLKPFHSKEPIHQTDESIKSPFLLKLFIVFFSGTFRGVLYFSFSFCSKGKGIDGLLALMDFDS